MLLDFWEEPYFDLEPLGVTKTFCESIMVFFFIIKYIKVSGTTELYLKTNFNKLNQMTLIYKTSTVY